MSQITRVRTYIPGEIFDQIVIYLIPAAPFNPIALAADDILTKTLLSLTQTCQATHNLATKYLYEYCVYIDSLEKIHQLVRTLSSRKITGEEHKFPIISMYLTIYCSNNIHSGYVWDISYNVGLSDHDLTAVASLFKLPSPSLTRLLLQPLSALTASQQDLRKGFNNWVEFETMLAFKPFIPTAIDQAYFSAFQSLVNLEVLVNLSDIFNALNITRPIWTFFPKLWVLGMSDLPDYWRFLDNVWLQWISLERLETVIILEEDLSSECTFEEVWQREAGSGRAFNVVTVCTANRWDDEVGDVWRSQGKLRFRDVDVEGRGDWYGTRKGRVDRETALKWVMRRLLRGEECITS